MKVISVIREKLLLLKLDLTRTWKEKKRSHPLGVNTKFLFSKSWERQTSVSCKTVVTWVSSSGISSPSEILYLRNLPDTFPYFWCPLIYPSTPAPPPHPTPQQLASSVTSHIFQFFSAASLFSRNSHRSEVTKGVRGMRKIQSFCAESNCPGMSYHNDNNDNFIWKFFHLFTDRVFANFFFFFSFLSFIPSRHSFFTLKMRKQKLSPGVECIFISWKKKNFSNKLSQINVCLRLKFERKVTLKRIWCTFCHP